MVPIRRVIASDLSRTRTILSDQTRPATTEGAYCARRRKAQRVCWTWKSQPRIIALSKCRI